MSENRHERTICWDDPLATAHKGLAMSGRDYLLAMQGGELSLPPICHLLGFSIGEVEEGRVVHLGRQIAMAEGRIVDGGGRLHAAGVETCLVFDQAAVS
jgi:hypothetical protein